MYEKRARQHVFPTIDVRCVGRLGEGIHPTLVIVRYRVYSSTTTDCRALQVDSRCTSKYRPRVVDYLYSFHLFRFSCCSGTSSGLYFDRRMEELPTRHLKRVEQTERVTFCLCLPTHDEPDDAFKQNPRGVPTNNKTTNCRNTAACCTLYSYR